MMTPVNNGTGGASSASGSSENPWDTIQQMVAGTIGTKIQGRHISNHNLASRLFLANQGLGKSMGLSEEIMRQITPFPVPSNNTFIMNENPGVAELLSHMLTAQQSRPDVPLPTAPVATPAPAPVPQAPATQPQSTWKNWLWPAIAAAGIATAGGTALALWPDAPPDVTADYEVTAR